MDRKWGLAILAVGGIYLWSKREEVAAAISPGLTLAVTPGQAKAILAEPSKAAAALDSYVAAHPTSYSLLEQAKARIADGTAEPEDIVRLSATLRAYNEYVQDGGTDTYEGFTVNNYSSMPEKYMAIIDEAKAATVRARADEVEATGQHTLEYKLATLSHTNPLWQELATRHPELVSKEDFAAAVAAGGAIPARDVVAAVVNETTVPDGFTASQKQLDELVAAGVEKTTDVYQSALDLAYIQAAARCNDGDVVSYSNDGGYEASSPSDISEAAASAPAAEAWTYYT